MCPLNEVACSLARARAGMAAYFVLFLAGQLSTGLLIDTIGAFGVAVQTPSALRITGVSAVFVSSAVLQYLKHRPRAGKGGTADVSQARMLSGVELGNTAGPAAYAPQDSVASSVATVAQK